MTSPEYIQRVAIVGAGGSSGTGITAALLATNKHTVTALTRADSTTRLPAGVRIAHIDYADPSTLTTALRDQDALIITLPTGPLSALETAWIDAAARARVPWILPNEWAQDSAHAGLVTDIGLQRKQLSRAEIAAKGVSAFVGVVTGPWFEWGVAKPEAFGFDVRERVATFYDAGETKVCTSTHRRIGQAVAKLLSLPVSGDGVSLERFRNRVVYLSSFTVTQREVFASILRVTGVREEDWTVSYEPVVERRRRAQVGEGMDPKVAIRMQAYARLFYPDDSANFEKTKGTINEALGLPVEDLDNATKVAIDLLD